MPLLRATKKGCKALAMKGTGRDNVVKAGEVRKPSKTPASYWAEYRRLNRLGEGADWERHKRENGICFLGLHPETDREGVKGVGKIETLARALTDIRDYVRDYIPEGHAVSWGSGTLTIGGRMITFEQGLSLLEFGITASKFAFKIRKGEVEGHESLIASATETYESLKEGGSN